MELGHSPEEAHRLIDRELKDISDVQTLVGDLQRLAVVALPAAGLAGDINWRQKVHLNFEKTISLALLAAPAFDIEAEATGVVAADPGGGDRGEEIPDLVEHPGVGGRVGSWGTTNGCLIDDDALLEELQIANLAMGPGALFRSIPLAEKGAPQNIVDERGLATAADAGHARHRSQRDAGIDIAQIILGGSKYLDPSLVLARFDPVAWHRNAQISGKVTPGAGTRMGHDFSRSSVGHQFATMDSGSRPHIQDIVGGPDGVFVMLHHDDRIAGIPQATNRLQQPVVVALMQSDAGLIQDVEHPHQSGADLGRQANALSLATAQ